MSCGRAGSFASPRHFGDLQLRDASVWFGNSGGPVYSSDGALVGLLVRLAWCNTADALIYHLTHARLDTCGGRVTSINDSSVMP